VTERLAPYVAPPRLTEARLARQWADIDPRSLPSTPRRSGMVALAAGLCAVFAVGLVLRGRVQGSSHDAIEGSVIESGTVTLSDGSRVAVGEDGRVRVQTVHDDSVILALDRGSIDLAVPHAKRTLVVRTPAYDVVDVGTRFRVVLGVGGDVRVEVAEGAVEVRSRTGNGPPRRIQAGESWAHSPGEPPPSVPSASTDLAEPAPSAPLPSAPFTPARDVSAGPKELLESAERARLAGQPRVESVALDTLRRRFRADPRAALAAFELGRVRLDSLGDGPGAVEAFDDAIALAPRGPLREDAEARRVEALAAERAPQCASARDAFLARYPHSAHGAAVAQRCASE
jgi:hypothetical protein